MKKFLIGFLCLILIAILGVGVFIRPYILEYKDIVSSTDSSEVVIEIPKGTATKQANQSGSEGVTVTLPEFKAESVEAQTLYTVKFDVEHAGQATLTISLNDEPVESVVIDTELNDNAQ